MIYAVNWNPAMDLAFTLNQPLEADQVYSKVPTLWRPGGKGSNVARTVKRWGEAVTAVGFYGGQLGIMIEDALVGLGIPVLGERIPSPNRLCITIVDGAQGVTEIRERGPEVTSDRASRLLDRLIERVEPSDWVTLSGSLPHGLPPETAAIWAERLRPITAGVLVDMSGAALHYSWQAGATAVFPNQSEYREVSELLKTEDNPTGHLVVTEGAAGLTWHPPGQQPPRHIDAPRVHAKNPVGAGDVLLGTLVAYRARGLDWDEALTMAASAASASVEEDAVADFDVKEAERLRAEISLPS